MSGDEFIILMYGCGEREASKRMQEAQRLAEQGTARSGEAAELLPGFSYGVFELGSDENIGFQAAFLTRLMPECMCKSAKAYPVGRKTGGADEARGKKWLQPTSSMTRASSMTHW